MYKAVKCGRYGEVVRKLGHIHYVIKLHNGYAFKRHIDQLRSTNVSENNDINIPSNDKQQL